MAIRKHWIAEWPNVSGSFRIVSQRQFGKPMFSYGRSCLFLACAPAPFPFICFLLPANSHHNQQAPLAGQSLGNVASLPAPVLAPQAKAAHLPWINQWRPTTIVLAKQAKGFLHWARGMWGRAGEVFCILPCLVCGCSLARPIYSLCDKRLECLLSPEHAGAWLKGNKEAMRKEKLQQILLEHAHLHVWALLSPMSTAHVGAVHYWLFVVVVCVINIVTTKTTWSFVYLSLPSGFLSPHQTLQTVFIVFLHNFHLQNI